MAPGAIDTQVIYEDPTQYLSASISSLSSQRSASTQTSWIAKSYRNATQLFLTRRLAEALEAVSPIVQSLPGEQDAPIASSSKVTRIRVWSFYLTLLDAIIQLGPEEGKTSFGTRYKELVTKVEQGTIWADVVSLGYGGSEGAVDGEVVANLVTLLLSHMASQKVNQQRLEAFLSASAMPAFDITAHMAGRPEPHRSRSGDGTSTPRDLNTRLKIIELYTLHVLPRNEEWDYARDFLSLSEVLDDERREAFQHALRSVREEQSHEALVRKQQHEQEQAALARQQIPNRSESSHRKQRPASRQRASTTGSSVSARDRKAPKPPPPKPSDARPKMPGQVAPATLYRRATTLLAVFRTFVRAKTSVGVSTSILRLLLFLMAFAFALARRDVRARTRRIMTDAWDKVRQTLGMGLRVSYV